MNEFDPGETPTDEDLEKVRHQTKMDYSFGIIHLYSLQVHQKWWHWWGRTSNKLYTAGKDNTYIETKLRICDDGWALLLGKKRKAPRYCTIAKRVEIIFDPNQDLCNFKYYDLQGRQILRLIGDGRAGITLHELELG
jgi:hypothetical protein